MNVFIHLPLPFVMIYIYNYVTLIYHCFFIQAYSLIFLISGTIIEKTSDEPPTVVTTFYTEGLSVRSSSKLNILNLVILTSPDRQTGTFSWFIRITSAKEN